MSEYHIKFKGGHNAFDLWVANLHTDKEDYVLYKNGEEFKTGKTQKCHDPKNFTEFSILSTFTMYAINAMDIDVGYGHIGIEEQKEMM